MTRIAPQRIFAIPLSQSDIDGVMALYSTGHFAEVVAQCEALAARHPGQITLYNILGAACVALRDFAGAEAAFRQAIAISGTHAELHNNLGAALEPQGKLDEAAACYRQALALNPDYASACYNLGNVMRAQHAIPDAIALYERAIALKPDYQEAYNNLGLALQKLGRFPEAIEFYKRAMAINPHCAKAVHNIGTVLLDLRDYDGAIGALDLALSIDPDNSVAFRQKLFAHAQICDFSAIAAAPPAHEPKPGAAPIPPFIMLPAVDDPAQQLRCSQAWAQATNMTGRHVPGTAQRGAGERIRIGYFSADFHNHATLYLMSGLLREHDRERFEIFAYSYGVPSEDDARTRLIADVDRFEEVRDLSDAEVVALVRGHGLDIAVDLKGYTEHSRSQLFAQRLAPVQINYLGYPGSLGSDCMDYLVADPVLIPQDCRGFYSENIIYLPDSYQPNDDQRAITETGCSRRHAGLPEQGLVFCCFNQSYKIGAAEFDIWMRVLCAVDGSVLWLMRSSPATEANLRQEARLRGVNPDRLVFAEALPHAEHLARLKLADLFLDTFNYNAHTTASDALWAGLPVVTKAGRQFAARVGASLIQAVGLPELITESEQAYEARVLELASDPSSLAAIRTRLGANRRDHPLFGTARYTRHLESAYAAVHQRQVEGLAPADVTINRA